MIRLLQVAFTILFALQSIIGCGKTLSPFDFGLLDAKNDIERYEVLLRMHQQAAGKGLRVSYKGIKQIDIEVPRSGTSIPLSYNTDFAGVTIVVRNVVKNTPLFILKKEVHEVSIEKGELASRDFRNHNELRRGKKLLIIEDQTRWVEQRTGYSSGAIRKDVLLLNNGKALNNVVTSYDNEESNPKFMWCDAANKKIVFKNLCFVRSADSKAITYLCSFSNENNIRISNVSVKTPANSGLYGDAIFKFENCTNIKLEGVSIDGTYSLKDKYGYGIGMNNVWNAVFLRLKADGNWGVFGNNNVNTAYLDDCDINRFDIHCYGRDVHCKKTTFRNLYNQFSSLYGTLSYEDCRFVHFVPVLFESSYSAYTHFNLVIKNCAIDVDADRPYLINAGNPAKLATKPRAELAKASWPNVVINNLIVNLPTGEKDWTLFELRGGGGSNIYDISEMIIEGLEIRGASATPKVRFSNRKMKFDKDLDIRVTKSSINTID